MIGHGAFATAGRDPDDVAHAARSPRRAARGGPSRSAITLTIPRSEEASAGSSRSAERLAAEYGVVTRVELAPRALTIHLHRRSERMDDVLILLVIVLSALLTYGLVILSERVR